MTLREHLAAGYHHATHGGPDPISATRAEIPESELHAEIARLEGGVHPVVRRDHISRVWVAYMKRVLKLPVDPPPGLTYPPILPKV